jgi:hypothetical protein
LGASAIGNRHCILWRTWRSYGPYIYIIKLYIYIHKLKGWNISSKITKKMDPLNKVGISICPLFVFELFFSGDDGNLSIATGSQRRQPWRACSLMPLPSLSPVRNNDIIRVWSWSSWLMMVDDGWVLVNSGW